VPPPPSAGEVVEIEAGGTLMLNVVFLPPDPDTLPDTAKRNLQVLSERSPR